RRLPRDFRPQRPADLQGTPHRARVGRGLLPGHDDVLGERLLERLPPVSLMEIRVTGLNHKRAPVELREKLAVDDAAIQSALAELQKSFAAQEMVILSTCNRVELYSVHDGAPPGPAEIAGVLARRHGVAAETLSPA